VSLITCACREDVEVHEENLAKDAEAAHIAAGGEKTKTEPKEKEPTKVEKWLEWFKGTWFGKRPWVVGEWWCLQSIDAPHHVCHHGLCWCSHGV